MGFTCGTLKDGDGLTVVWAIGEVDLAVAARLGAEIEPHLTAGSTVALDCAGITFMDSMGVQILAREARIAEQLKADFILVTVTEPVRQVLELSGLSTAFTVFDTLTQARAEIAKR